MSEHQAPATGRTVATNALWRFLEAAGGEIVSLVVFMAMARLLAPESFGVVALAGVIISLAQTVLQQGLGNAVIQGASLGAKRLATAFWLNLGLGFLLMATTLGLALPLAALFGNPELAGVLAALTLVLPIGAVSAAYQAKLVRRLAFKAIALRALAASSVGGIVGLTIAAGGGGVWALVGLQLSSMATGLAVLVLADPWQPRFVVDAAEARALVRFAMPLVGTHVAKFAGKKLDIAILGLFATATSIGYYFLATRLIFALGLATHYTLFSLTLPVLSRLQTQPAAFRTAAARTLWLTVAFCLPAGIGLALIAEPLVGVVFGETWTPSVPPLQILAALSIFYALGLISGQILVAAGKPGLFLRLTIANTALFLILVALAAPHGLAAVALAGGLANALMVPAYLVVLKRSLGLEIAGMLREQLPLWAAAAVMTGSVLAAEMWLLDGLGLSVQLGGALVVGLASYATALWLLAGGAVRALLATLRPVQPVGQ